MIETGNPASRSHLSVTDNSAECHPFGATFTSICNEAQVPSSTTPYREGEGVSSYLMTTRNGMRCSSAVAFLWPAMKRANLAVRTNASVRRIAFEAGRAVSVTFRHKGAETVVRARREIILSAGAIGTPQILQLSGVGDGASLQKLGLDVVQNQPAVGQNLQDHFGINYLFKANRREGHLDIAASIFSRFFDGGRTCKHDQVSERNLLGSRTCVEGFLNAFERVEHLS